MVRVRFAPSPTGALHIGGARTALFNYLLARSLGGKFLLRIDDTDTERSLPEHESDIKDCLKWLGLQWDEGPEVGGDHGPYRQSERKQIHLAHAQTLVEKNLAYVDNDKSVRLRYPASSIIFEDEICGRCEFQPDSLGPEVVLVRPDGTPTFHLGSVSDDISMQITHVVRGQDHLTNTAKHVLIFRGLEAPCPTFAHLGLILGEDRTKLSKRSTTGMTTVREFKQAGYLPQALNNFLMLLGWSHPDAVEQISLEQAISVFALSRVSKTAAVFETAKLDFLNGWWIRHLPLETVAAELRPFLFEFEDGLNSRGQKYWLEAAEFLRSQIGFLSEAPALAKSLFALQLELTPVAEKQLEQPEFRAAATQVSARWLSLLSDTPLSEPGNYYTKDDFSKMLSVLKKEVPGEKKNIFQSLRIAIIGNPVGPELNAIIPLIPREILIERAREAKRLFE